MSGGKPRKSADPLYLLLREGGSEEFNRRSKAGELSDLRGCDFRGIDLRGVDVANIDFSDCYFRQADPSMQHMYRVPTSRSSLHQKRSKCPCVSAPECARSNGPSPRTLEI
jgi:hypothetical protein